MEGWGKEGRGDGERESKFLTTHQHILVLGYTVRRRLWRRTMVKRRCI